MKSICYSVLFLLFASNLFAQQDFNVRKTHFNLDKSGLALQGYDPISYFENKPNAGKPEIFFYYKGVKYLFSTQAHLETFKASPEKYEPAYGGWCAYAMAKTGDKVEVDPMKYKIVNGRLNLFYYNIINNTLNKWNENENEQSLKPEADKHWVQTIAKNK